MNDLIPASFGALSSLFAGVPATADNDLAAGVQAGFGLIGYKGKVWSVRHRGDETALMREDGDGPRASIELILLKSSTHISKIFYKDGYVEGSTAAPDCFSTNGVVPDASVAVKQSAACANCPMNAWGSRITPAGKQGKMCSDSKRVAVVPAQDPANEAFGGPMLLRVPAASLQDLAAYGTKLGQLSYPYFAVATRIAFDVTESYPKFVFSAIRPLTDAEAAIVLKLRDDISVTRILSDSVELTPAAAPAITPAQVFEQPPVQAAPAQVAPAPAPVAAAPSNVVPLVAPAQAAPIPTAAAAPQSAPQTTAQTTSTVPLAAKAAAAFGGAAAPAPAQPAPVTPEVTAAPVAAAPTTNGFGIPEPGDEATSEMEEALNAQLSALLPA